MNNRKQTNARGKNPRQIREQVIIESKDRTTRLDGKDVLILKGTRIVLQHRNFSF